MVATWSAGRWPESSWRSESGPRGSRSGARVEKPAGAVSTAPAGRVCPGLPGIGTAVPRWAEGPRPLEAAGA